MYTVRLELVMTEQERVLRRQFIKNVGTVNDNGENEIFCASDDLERKLK